jgi:TRAP-type C4-dicarboxylate transport system permease small subunit
MIATLNKAADALRKAAETLTWILAAILVAIVTANVFARYALEIGILWIEEVSRLAFVWLVFLGAYVALCRRGHMAITLLVKRMHPKSQVRFLLLSRLLVLVFLAGLMWAGTELVLVTLQYGRTSPILGISAAWGYVAVPFAGLLMFIETLRELLNFEPLPVEESDEAVAAVDPA